jgi:hypothetical protein
MIHLRNFHMRRPERKAARGCKGSRNLVSERTKAADHAVQQRMRFVTPSNRADPEAAARKLIEIANATEAVQDGRIHIELINLPFLRAGGTAAEYRAGIEHAVNEGWLWCADSGVYVKFTQSGAEQFA